MPTGKGVLLGGGGMPAGGTPIGRDSHQEWCTCSLPRSWQLEDKGGEGVTVSPVPR